MGFICENIGESGNPDILINHQSINPDDRWDIECTLTANYNITRWDEDIGKFHRYSTDRNLSRLLIVCNSRNITSDVIIQLNNSREPIGLIDFNDLKRLNESFRTDGDSQTIYNRLSQNGRIVLGSPLSQAEISEVKPFRIKRYVGI